MTKLLPCPFCGGTAQVLNFDDEEVEPDNFGGSCISCTKCEACTAVVFGFKETLYSSWNERVLPHEILRLQSELTSVERLQEDRDEAISRLQRIDEELIGSYGEVETIKPDALRKVIGNIILIMRGGDGG